MKEVAGVIAAFLLIVSCSFGCTAALRSHGITSCEQRGGEPITSSWLSEDAWDVKCLGG